VGLAVAFAAGLLSFLSPCVLPLIPSYVGFLTGMSAEDAHALRIKDVDLFRAYMRAVWASTDDFVAKTDLFQQTAKQIADAAIGAKAADRLTLLTTQARPGVTVEQLIDQASASLKEKLELGRFARLEGGYVASYLHRSDAALPPTLGVLIQLDKDNAEVAKDLAQQVAAMRPLYTTRDEVPADVVEKERRIAEQITRDEGKPEQAIGKIVDGRLNAYFKDVVLTEQAFVKDQKTAIKQVLAQNGVTVTGFARFQVGQA